MLFNIQISSINNTTEAINVIQFSRRNLQEVLDEINRKISEFPRHELPMKISINCIPLLADGETMLNISHDSLTYVNVTNE